MGEEGADGADGASYRVGSMAARGSWAAMRESSARMRGERLGGGRGGSRGCGVVLWVGGRSESRWEVISERAVGVGGASMSRGVSWVRWGEGEKGGEVHGRESWEEVIRGIFWVVV